MKTYKIVRHFFLGEKEVLDTGLTLQEAQDWCSDPETSSKTCTSRSRIKLTEERGDWFDGFTEE